MESRNEDATLIDAEIAKAQGEIKNLEQKIASLRKQKNAYLPVFRIPSEVLLQIFELIWLLPSHGLRTSWDWKNITSTCRHWRSLTLGTAYLWKDISCFHRPDMAEAFLQRSKKMDIDIKLSPDNGLPLHLDVFRMMTSHLKRVRELMVSYKDDSRVWVEIQHLVTGSGSLTRLKKLSLTAEFNNDGTPRSSIAFNQLHKYHLSAQLDDLRLDNVYIPIDNSIFRNLKILTLDRISGHPFTLENLIDILESSSRIESLRICDSGPSFCAIPERSTVQLRFLKHLSLMWMDSSVYSRIMELIAPGEIFQSHTVYSSYFFGNGLHLFSEQFAERTLADCNGVFVHIDDNNVDLLLFKEYDGEEDLKINIRTVPSFNVPAAFSFVSHFLRQPIFNPFVDSTLSIQFSDHNKSNALTKSIWINCFLLIPALDTLDVMLGTGENSRAFGILVSALSGTPPSWYRLSGEIFCPELKEFHIQNADFFSAGGKVVFQRLIELLHFRTEKGNRLGRLLFRDCRGVGSHELGELKCSDLADRVGYWNESGRGYEYF